MGRHEETRDILTTFHANGDSDHPLIALEMTEMMDAVEREGTLSWRTFFDLRVLFKTRARRYRIALNIAFSWFGQFSGNKYAYPFRPRGKPGC